MRLIAQHQTLDLLYITQHRFDITALGRYVNPLMCHATLLPCVEVL